MRRQPLGGIRRALAPLLLVSCAHAILAGSQPWYWHYQEAEHAIAAGRLADAERELKASIAARPDPGCRIRIYGIKYRDYVPRYWLGVVLEQQGRNDEARAAFEDELARGVISECAGTMLQAADLAQRLERFAARQKAATPEPQPETLAHVDGILRDAVAAGASQLAPAELQAARAALERARAGDAAALDEALEHARDALWRARTESPLVALLRREADESLQEARRRLAEIGAPSAARDRAQASIDEASALLASGEGSTQSSLAAQAAAERALSQLRGTRTAQPPAPPPRPADTRRAPSDDELASLLELSWSASAGSQPRLKPAAAGQLP